MSLKTYNYNINWNEISDYEKIQTLTTNTKTRRLGYLKLLAFFFTINKQVPKSIIDQKFELLCQDYKDELKKYKNSKGVISRTESGGSAKPYIELAKNLRLLSISNNRYSPGKSFQVYLECEHLWSENFFLSRNLIECTF